MPASPANPAARLQGAGAAPRADARPPLLLVALDQFGRGRLPGYTGYKPRAGPGVAAQLAARAPTAETTQGFLNSQVGCLLRRSNRGQMTVDGATFTLWICCLNAMLALICPSLYRKPFADAARKTKPAAAAARPAAPQPRALHQQPRGADGLLQQRHQRRARRALHKVNQGAVKGTALRGLPRWGASHAAGRPVAVGALGECAGHLD